MKLRTSLFAAGLIACAGLATPALADPANIGKVIITEIFCNPAGNDDIEFIEIFNTTNEPIDISGWYIDDEDSTSSYSFPAGTILPPRTAKAVIGKLFQGVPPNDPNNPGQFLPSSQTWINERLDAAFPNIPNAHQNFIVLDLNITIANTPTLFNEIPFLVDNSGTVVDVANYENAVNGWPAVTSGVSIQLRPQFLNSVDNDRGCSWANSTSPQLSSIAQASSEVVFSYQGSTPYRMAEPGNVCSPGIVLTVSPAGQDCNGNGIDDAVETCGALATSPDCNGNLIPDACEPDLNGNGTPDDCDILLDREGTDRNMNNVLDSIDINLAGGSNGRGGTLDTNNNGILDGAEDFGKIIITEFMIDPFASLVQAAPLTAVSSSLEWVEIQNVSSGTVDISGYRILDLETGGDGYSLPVPAGTIMAPGEIAVLCQLPAFPTAQGGANYTAAQAVTLYQNLWGATTPQGVNIRWIPLARWSPRAFNATQTAEVLTLVKGAIVNDAVVPATQPTVSGPHPTRLNGPGTIGTWVTNRGFIIDMANYSNANSNNEPLNGWPGSDSHSTFYLLPGARDVISNNSGTNWRAAISGLDGVRQSNDLTGQPNFPYGARDLGEDFGSPGFVPATVQQPSGEVLITEISATTNSVYPGSIPVPAAPTVTVAGRDEWVEIVNTTSATIDMTGWYLQDEDGRTSGFPAGSVLLPGQAAVVLGVDTFTPTGTNFPPGLAPLTNDFVQEFKDAWGCGYPIFAVTDWYTSSRGRGLDRLADGPSFINEILRLVKPDGSVSDVANYDDDSTPTAIAQPPFGWPGDAVAGISVYWSIYTLPGNYTQGGNDLGTNWAASLTGFDGGRQSIINTTLNAAGNPTGLFNRSTYGSPGYVEGITAPGTIIPAGEGCVPARCLADVVTDGTVDGNDFIAFINSFSIGDAAIDPIADVAGGGTNGDQPDGTIDGSDFIAFINAFAAGC
jgi:hypothetical protein